MTPLLLDTVFLIRWSQGRVPKRVKRRVDQPDAALFVSTVSPWEISLKPALRHYGLNREDLLEIMLDDLAAEILPITLNTPSSLTVCLTFQTILIRLTACSLRKLSQNDTPSFLRTHDFPGMSHTVCGCSGTRIS